MRMYVIRIGDEEYECPTMEKLAEVVFDHAAESSEMCDEFWSKDVDRPLSVEAKDAMLRYRFHGSTVLVDALARHVLTLYARVIRSHLRDLEAGRADVAEWECEYCTVRVVMEDEEDIER